MRLRPALFAVLIAVVAACWFVAPAQQQAAADPDRVPIDSSQVTAITGEISLRSEHLKPMFEEVHVADWVAKGAPEAYTSQWKSLTEQNLAIQNDMTAIAQHPEAMQDIMRALFRVHRFDNDLNAMLSGVRRYQNPALADLIESVGAGDQKGIEKLQQYALNLADATERQLSVEDEEAQRCRSALANQAPVHAAAARKTPINKSTTGTSK